MTTRPLVALSLLEAVLAVDSGALTLPLAARRMEGAPRGHLPWASWRSGACAWCLETVYTRSAISYGDRKATAYEHLMVQPDGPRVRLLWHLACVASDPILEAMVDNENAPDGDAHADARAAALYAELVARLAALETDHPGARRAVIDVQRDHKPSVGLTLRNPATWGAETPIARPAFGAAKTKKKAKAPRGKGSKR